MSSGDLAGWIGAIAGVVAIGVGVLQLRAKTTEPTEPPAPPERPALDLSHNKVVVTLRSQYRDDDLEIGDTYTIKNESPTHLADVRLAISDPRKDSIDIPEHRTYRIGGVAPFSSRSGELSNLDDMCDFDAETELDENGDQIPFNDEPLNDWRFEKPHNSMLEAVTFADENNVKWKSKFIEDSVEEFTYFAREFTAEEH